MKNINADEYAPVGEEKSAAPDPVNASPEPAPTSSLSPKTRARYDAARTAAHEVGTRVAAATIGGFNERHGWRGPEVRRANELKEAADRVLNAEAKLEEFEAMIAHDGALLAAEAAAGDADAIALLSYRGELEQQAATIGRMKEALRRAEAAYREAGPRASKAFDAIEQRRKAAGEPPPYLPHLKNLHEAVLADCEGIAQGLDASGRMKRVGSIMKAHISDAERRELPSAEEQLEATLSGELWKVKRRVLGRAALHQAKSQMGQLEEQLHALHLKEEQEKEDARRYQQAREREREADQRRREAEREESAAEQKKLEAKRQAASEWARQQLEASRPT